MSHPNSDKGDVEAKQELAGYIEYWIDSWDNFEYEHYDEFVEEHNRIWSNYFDVEIDGNLLSEPDDWRVDNSNFFEFVMSCLHEDGIDSRLIWKALNIFQPIWCRLLSNFDDRIEYATKPNEFGDCEYSPIIDKERLIYPFPSLPIPRFPFYDEDWQIYPYYEEYADSVNDDDLYNCIMVEKLSENKREMLYNFYDKEVYLESVVGNVPHLVSIRCKVESVGLGGDYTSLDDILQASFYPDAFHDLNNEQMLMIEQNAKIEYSWDEKDEDGNWVKGKISSVDIYGPFEGLINSTPSRISFHCAIDSWLGPTIFLI